MTKFDSLSVNYHDRKVGTLSFDTEGRLCVDDHCKNFSFLVLKSTDGKWQWCLAPAYDLTLNEGGYNGEHATSVNGTVQPKTSDFIEVGNRIRISKARCIQLIEQVADNCGNLIRYNPR